VLLFLWHHPFVVDQKAFSAFLGTQNLDSFGRAPELLTSEFETSAQLESYFELRTFS